MTNDSPREQRAARPFRVLMVSQHPYPQHPTLRRNANELSRHGIETDVVCMSAEGVTWAKKTDRPGMRLFAIPLQHRRSRVRYVFQYLAFFAWSLLVTNLLSLTRRYDVVQVDTLPDFLVFSAIVPRLRRTRLILYVYDLMPEMTVSRLRVGPGHWLVRLAAFLESAATRSSDQVITVSDLFRRVMATRGLDAAKTTLVANSHPIGEVPEVAPAKVPFLVIQTTLIERYGVQVAIRALARLKDRWPELTLKVLGDGEYLPTLRALATDLGVGDRVQFTGRYLPWHEAMQVVRQGQVGIIPIVRDGYGEMILPNKVLELVAMDVPAACSHLPGIHEHFPPDSLAYFEPGDDEQLATRVDALLSDPAAARRQAERAREAMSELVWERASQRYLGAVLGAPTDRDVAVVTSRVSGHVV